MRVKSDVNVKREKLKVHRPMALYLLIAPKSLFEVKILGSPLKRRKQYGVRLAK